MRSASGRATSLVARLVFALAMVAATWAYYHRLDDLPPWLDYDSAQIGIFVNNASYRDHYDEYFRESRGPQYVYRAGWAANFLPGTVVMSSIQRLFGIAPDRTGELLKITGLFLGALGTICAALVATRGLRDTGDAFFLFGLVASMPPFLLFLRTAVPHFLYSYLMFWLATLCIERYLSGRGRRWVYALSLVMALYAMLPYVPIAVLPVVGVLLALWHRAAGRVLRDRHFYVAGALGVALFAALRFSVAVAHEPSYEAWTAKAAPFLAQRVPHAMSTEFLEPSLFAEKLTKLAHQHFVYQIDQLGDRSRSDALWTLPEPHLVWLALLPLALFGAWRSRRGSDSSAAAFAAVLIATYAFALSVSFPEGRYLIPAVPALAFFVLQGLRALVPQGTPRVLAYSVILVAMAWNSFALVSGPYEQRIVGLWQNRAGMQEALALIRARIDPEYGRSRELRFSWREMDHEVWLYMQMLANLRVRNYNIEGNLARVAPGETLFAAVRSLDTERIRDLQSRGFRSLGTVSDPFVGRPLEVLALER